MNATIINKNVAKYNELSNARGAATHRTTYSAIILGDDGKYWLTTRGFAQQLVTAGYELEGCYRPR